MAGQRDRIILKRADKPNLLKREYFELAEDVYDVIEKAREILEIGSNEEIKVTTGEGLELKEEDYDKKLCETEWRMFILKPLPRRQRACNAHAHTMQRALTETMKEIRNKKVVENVDLENCNVQKKLLHGGLRGFHLKIIPDSLTFCGPSDLPGLSCLASLAHKGLLSPEGVQDSVLTNYSNYSSIQIVGTE